VTRSARARSASTSSRTDAESITRTTHVPTLSAASELSGRLQVAKAQWSQTTTSPWRLHRYRHSFCVLDAIHHGTSWSMIAGTRHRAGDPTGTLDAVASFDWISLCTDYGYADGFVAACHGVIVRLAPHTRVLDVTHAIRPGDVRHGAVVLTDTLPWLPAAVHVAVVDPGVGTARRGVALVLGNTVLVGPDNGLLLPAAEALGGVRSAYELTEPAYRLPTVSATFHGRDVFAPAAAHLAIGVPPDALGPEVDPASLVALPAPVCQVNDDRIRAEVLTVDHFGNVALAAGAAELDAIGLRPGAAATLQWPAGAQRMLLGRTFADVAQGELMLLVDSAGHLAVACHGSSAAHRAGLQPGAIVEIIR
jgi:S-adenosyl-L-methionine hydrolase (adenosine-forming)